MFVIFKPYHQRMWEIQKKILLIFILNQSQGQQEEQFGEWIWTLWKKVDHTQSLQHPENVH